MECPSPGTEYMQVLPWFTQAILCHLDGNPDMNFTSEFRIQIAHQGAEKQTTKTLPKTKDIVQTMTLPNSHPSLASLLHTGSGPPWR